MAATAYDAVSQEAYKASVIVVLSNELLQLGNPAAERTVRETMVAGVAAFLDAQFLTNTVTLVANTRPAAITNGATAVTSHRHDRGADERRPGAADAPPQSRSDSTLRRSWLSPRVIVSAHPCADPSRERGDGCQGAPARLTDTDLEHLSMFDPALAQHGLEQRFKALHPAPAPPPAPKSGIDVEAFADAIVETIKGAVAPLVARIEQLEQRPELQYRGVYEDNQAYGPGCLVTKGGSLWLCLAATAIAPGSDSNWRLIVKQGKA